MAITSSFINITKQNLRFGEGVQVMAAKNMAILYALFM
jgi:hypothetical protein